MMNRLFFLLIISVLSVQLYGQDISENDEIEDIKGDQNDFRSFLREGNRQYNADKVEDAERSYRRALSIDDRSDMAAFNLGSALYRQERFEDAVREFEKVASATTDKMEKAKAYHNLGNSYLQQQKLKESIEAYKQALRNNPNDLDTKYNLSFALKMLQQQEQKQDKSQEDNEIDEILEEAKKLVAQRKYQEAYTFMKENEKKYPRLLQYADFTNRILDIIKLNQ